MQKNWFTIFNVKVTARAYKLYNQIMTIFALSSVSSEPQNILLPNLVWLCSIISQSVVQKNWFTVFKVTVTVGAYIIKILLILLYLLNSW